MSTAKRLRQQATRERELKRDRQETPLLRTLILAGTVKAVSRHRGRRGKAPAEIGKRGVAGSKLLKKAGKGALGCPNA